MATSPTEGVDVAEYCRIHAKRAEAEGLTKTAQVLEWAADEIEALRKQISNQKDTSMLLVPIEPTDAMVRASTRLAPTWDDATSRAKWAAMLAAFTKAEG